MLKVVSFYTNDFYKAKADALAQSLGKFGVTYEITKVTGPATWREAVAYKPRFILDSLLSSACDYLVYTDADSQLLQPIPFKELAGDLAYHPFRRSPHHEEETLTGTMAFKNTMEVRAFLLDWIGATEKWKTSDTPEQHSLAECLGRTSLNVQRLGPEWCFIFDDMREIHPNASPIFEHYQASRQYKAAETAEEAAIAEEVTEYLPDPSEWKRAKGRTR